MNQIVCPNFYVDEWEEQGEKHTELVGAEFEIAADDGVCRLLKSVKDPFGGVLLVCRCGIRFKPSDGKHVAVRK